MPLSHRPPKLLGVLALLLMASAPLSRITNCSGLEEINQGLVEAISTHSRQVIVMEGILLSDEGYPPEPKETRI
jgi:hypothetical protein